VRFPNEIEIWNDYGFETTSVRIERPKHENILTPEQRLQLRETALDNWIFDLTLTATSEVELLNEINKKLIPRLLSVKE
jgi:hypothetical protein